jgi:hypothetical protein
VPTHIRALCSWAVGSSLPRDVMQVTPCFRHQAVLPFDDPNWQDLADDLAVGLNGWASGSATRQLTVKLYEIGGEKPNRPKAVAVNAAGSMSETSYPREVCVCFSFYGGRNAAHQRGRLYLPYWTLSSTPPAVRPSVSHRDKVVTLAPVLAGLGGVDVDWIVWSPTRNEATKVEHVYADDEWDIQRRRGLKPTTRSEATTGG